MGKNLTTNDEYTILEGSWKLEQKPKNKKYLKKKIRILNIFEENRKARKMKKPIR